MTTLTTIDSAPQRGAGATPLQPYTARWQTLWRSPAINRLLIILIAISAAAVNFWSLGGPGLWYDEAVSVGLARQPSWLVWHYIWGPEPNMELYYVLLHDWIQLLTILHIQPTEFMLRLPSALFGVMAAIVLYRLGDRFFGGRVVGLTAALLCVFNQMQVAAAQQVRSYSMEIFFCCLLVYAFLEALLIASQPERSRRSRILWWGAFTLVASLVPYVHLFSGLVLLSIGILFLLLLLLPGAWRDAARRSFRYGFGSFALIALAMIPAAWVSRHGGKNSWIGPASIHTVTNWLVGLSNGEGLYLAISAVVVVVGLSLSLFAWGSSVRNGSSPGTPGMLALICWFLIPAGISFAVTQTYFNLHLFFPRYLIVVAPAWWLAIAWSLNELRQKSSLVATGTSVLFVVGALYASQINLLIPLIVFVVGAALFLLYERQQRIILALLLLTLAMYGTPAYYVNAAQQDFRTPAEWLQQRYQSGDGVFCFPNYACSVPMGYYLWAYPGSAHFDPNSPGVYNWASGKYAMSATLASAKVYATRHARIFFIQAVLNHGSSNGHDIMAWLRQHYTLVAQYSSTVNKNYPRTVMIQLYVRRAHSP